jgi:hypothetical protein
METNKPNKKFDAVKMMRDIRDQIITPSSVYENHLLNATIDVSKLSKHYVGINLVQESKIKKVVKWLN